jgi:glycolate oxidase FAD binding subunit
MQILKPASKTELIAHVQSAMVGKTPLEIVAGGSKRLIGRPVEAEHLLDLGGFSGVMLYEPEELVLTAGAATPLREVETLLSEKGQQLAFEPPYYNALLGSDAEPTLGGVLAANLAGPRRFVAGAARDHLLGFHAVSGRGEEFKAGGRVVKNVTGYDLSKLICGSWGTLCALTEVSVKVLPRAPHSTTLIFEEASALRAVNALSLATGSPQEVSGAAFVPGELRGGASVFALRLEGVRASVEFRAHALRHLLADYGVPQSLERDASETFWQSLRDVEMLVEPRETAVWKVSVPPLSGANVLEAMAPARAYLDWAGGLVWLALEPTGAAALRLRAVVAQFGGHATLIRAPQNLRAMIDVFEPPASAVTMLAKRLKENFDPERIFNPGRMYAGV